MKTILVTGVTGTVMGPVTTRLLEEGHTVLALVRGMNPWDKLARTTQIKRNLRRRLHVLSGDVTQPQAGMSAEHINHWKGKIDLVLHGAASIKFEESVAGELYQTNVLGTKHMLDLAQLLDVSQFHFVSTVYVAGDSPLFLETDRRGAQHFRNSYEDTKSQAEELVLNWSQGSCSIYRLPIVVGVSRTGEVGSFTGYYGFFKPFWQLKERLRERVGKDRTRLGSQGIRMKRSGIVSLPLYIPCSPEGPLQIMPIDWVADTMASLLAIPAEGKVFHFTHPTPPKVQWVIDTSLKQLGFQDTTSGESEVEATPIEAPLLQTLQAGVLRSIRPYAPYVLLDHQELPNTQLRETLERKGNGYVAPPVIDESLISTLLDFAAKQKFGIPQAEKAA